MRDGAGPEGDGAGPWGIGAGLGAVASAFVWSLLLLLLLRVFTLK